MSFYYEIIPTKIFRSDASTLTYSSDAKLQPGHIVRIPLGKSLTNGIVRSRTSKPAFACKPIHALLSPTPLPPHIVHSLTWLSAYYLTPLPQVASLVLPVGVEKSRRKKSVSKSRVFEFSSCPAGAKERTSTRTGQEPNIEPPKISLNSAQKSALAQLSSIKNTTKLLFGITGSGKTNIYLELTKQTLKKGKSVILLVPEIALTSQLVEIFEQTFPGRTVLLHSQQTEAERHLTWTQVLESTATPPENTPSDASEAPPKLSKAQPASAQPLIIIGPRSALLAPVGNLGLIIVDECHESSYFQENPPKYSAVRLASFIARSLSITCLLGSATPLISDFYLAKQKSSLVSLTEKAKSTAITPDIQVVDLTSRSDFKKSRYFSDLLLSTIRSNLEKNLQTLIYHNRRGSAPLTLCEHCGWQALCPACFLPLTLHADSYSLLCHTCGFEEKLPSSCPSCHSPSILSKGFGTKLLESELKKLFPEANILRFDADNKKSESLAENFDAVKSGEVNIIIGTQTVSRGLDLPYLASIGIVQADAGLSLPDFSAEEKTFELLTQVIGRVGRGHLSSASVIIQTYQPSSPLISLAKAADYPSFYDYLIKKRKKQLLPPFSYLCKLTVTSKTEATTLKKIRTVSRSLKNYLTQTSASSRSFSNSSTLSPQTETQTPSSVEPQSRPSPLIISPPMPCFHERTSSGFSWQIIVKSSNRSALLRLLSSLDPKLSVHISLDPPSLL